jgi:hypothetical protein
MEKHGSAVVPEAGPFIDYVCHRGGGTGRNRREADKELSPALNDPVDLGLLQHQFGDHD